MKALFTLFLLILGVVGNAQNIATTPLLIATDSSATVLGGGYPTLKWYTGDKTLNPKGNYDQVALFDSLTHKIKSGKINWHHLAGLGIIKDSDTAIFARKAALISYLLKSDTSDLARKSQLLSYLKIVDTSNLARKSQLLSYLLKTDTTDLARKSQLAAYLLKSDTTNFANKDTLSNYARVIDLMYVYEELQDLDNSLATVAKTGLYSDLIGKPTFAAVAMSGSYLDLLSKPTIPSAQINSDWNSSSGLSQILNKPTIPSAQVNSDWNSNSGVSQILNKPTIPAAQVNSDWNSSSGVSQILNKPIIKRVETYEGTTNSSGNYTVTFGTAFSSKPKIGVSMLTSNPRYNAIVTAVSTTGFTVQVTQYSTISVVGIEVLAGAPVVVNGASVSVIVSE